MDERKVCETCKISLPITDYYTYKNGNLYRNCKACHCAKTAAAKRARAAAETATEGTVTIGNFSLARRDWLPEQQDLIPAPRVFYGQEDLLERIVYALAENKTMLLEGDAGCGKTESLYHIAARVGMPVYRANLDADSDSASLIGCMTLADGKTVWVDGIITQAVRHGGLLIMDECNVARPAILTALYALLDSGKLTLLDNGGEVVTAHPDFRFAATQNPAGDPMYRGVEASSRALSDRIDLHLLVTYPSAVVEGHIVAHAAPEIDTTWRVSICRVAEKMREMVKAGRLDQPFTIRTSMRWAQMLAAGFSPRAALDMAYIARLEDFRRDSAVEAFKMIFPPLDNRPCGASAGDDRPALTMAGQTERGRICKWY